MRGDESSLAIDVAEEDSGSLRDDTDRATDADAGRALDRHSGDDEGEDSS